MANKQIVKLEGVISNVIIIVMTVSTIVDFPCGIRGKWGLPNDIM